MTGAAIPASLGKYQVRGVLGRGAMGIVYDGWDPFIERRVAIKTVPLPDREDQEGSEGLERFKREAQAAGRLVHPNIVGVFDYGETDALAFIVMEFVEGRSLKDLLDTDQRFPAASAVRIMGQVLDGLTYSHGRGVIHRDIKPANVILTADDQAKIADFGIARIEASSMTQAGTVMGTPAYMSPEQFMGQPVDGRTDIYSCGIVLYQLLAGERPFEGSMTSIMHKAMTTTPPRPSELAVTAPEALDPVVARAMARRPEDRFASAAAFAAALRDPSLAAPVVDADATIVAPREAAAPAAPRSAAGPAPARTKRNRLPLVVAGCVAVVAAGAAVVFLRPSSDRPQLASATPATPEPANRAPSQPAPDIAAPRAAAPSASTTPSVAVPPSVPSETAVASPPPAPTKPVETPRAAPAPAQEASVAPPPLASPVAPVPTAPAPPAAAPAPTPVMASPPPDRASVPCSVVQGGVAMVGAQSEAEFRKALAQTDIQPRVVDERFCPVLDLLRTLGSSSGTLVLTQDGGPAPLHDDDVIAVHATMPAFAGFLQVAYVQHDLTVAPLIPGAGYPAQTYAARASIGLGKPRRDSPGWRVGPPFGADMVVAVASTAPLFARPLPDTASLDDYVSTLRAAIEALRRRGGSVAATALPLDTRPAR